MAILSNIIYILLILFFLRAVLSTINTYLSYIFLNKREINKKLLEGKSKFIILIPVLREQKIIQETFEHFESIKGNFEVIYITTEKERFEKNKFANNKYTWEKIDELIKKYHSRKSKILHYNKINGGIAHQLNYALKNIPTKPNDYFIVYNADSRINKDFFVRLELFLNKNNYPEIVQQSSHFLKNYSELSSFLKSIALLQTRWTYVHEIPRIRFNSSKIGKYIEASHIVGHGLIIKSKILKSLNGFSEKYLNEDMPLGMKIDYCGYKVMLFDQLESSESPTKVKTMFNMYRTWFYGISYYSNYFRDFWKEGYIKIPKWVAVIKFCRYLLRPPIWLLTSLVHVLLILWGLYILIIYANIIPLAVYIISYVLYCVIPFILISKQNSINLKPSILIYSIFAYCTHSLGPILAMKDIVIHSITKKNIYKHKTERLYS